jgi:hypothetical protein
MAFMRPFQGRDGGSIPPTRSPKNEAIACFVFLSTEVAIKQKLELAIGLIIYLITAISINREVLVFKSNQRGGMINEK